MAQAHMCTYVVSWHCHMMLWASLSTCVPRPGAITYYCSHACSLACRSLVAVCGPTCLHTCPDKDIVRQHEHTYSCLLCPDATAQQHGHACLHPCSVLASAHGGMGGPICKSAKSQCHHVLAQPHLCTPASCPSVSTLWHRCPISCMRHECHVPVLHCGGRGKTIHILAASCPDIRGLGMPVPSHSFKTRASVPWLWHVCLHTDQVPVPHRHAVSQNHHMQAQACLSVHLLCPSTAVCCLGTPVSTPAMCQCSTAVHTPAMPLTASCQLSLCAFYVPAISHHMLQHRRACLYYLKSQESNMAT